MFQYDMLARSLAGGNGFRWYMPVDLARLAPYLHLDLAGLQLDPRGMLTTFRAPLYPAFLAIIYYVNGINDGRFFAARLCQAVIGALLAPLTYHTAAYLLPDHEKARRIAALIVAAYPMYLIFPIALATENLFFLLVLLAVLALLRAARKPTTARWLVAGLCLGLAALTRSIILLFAGGALLWIWMVVKQPRGAILAFLMLAATTAPWVIRNSLISHHLTGIETSLGYNLYVGYHPQSTGTFTFGPSLDLLSILDDRTRDEIGTQKAIQFIRQDPARFPYLLLRRTGYFFDLELRAFTYFYVNNFLGIFAPLLLAATLLVLAVPFVIVSLSAVFGSAMLPAQPGRTLLLVLFIGYLLPNVLILSEERFHLVLIPYLAILAGIFWTRGLTLLRPPNWALVRTLTAIALLLVLNWGYQLALFAPTLSQMFGPQGNQLFLPY